MRYAKIRNAMKRSAVYQTRMIIGVPPDVTAWRFIFTLKIVGKHPFELPGQQ